jgi:hypothetical protein
MLLLTQGELMINLVQTVHAWYVLCRVMQPAIALTWLKQALLGTKQTALARLVAHIAMIQTTNQM